MSYAPPSDDVMAFVRGRIASGFETPDEIRDAIEMYFGESSENAAAALKALPVELLAYEHAQKEWPAATDCDRLDAAFADLEARGIVARQNFACCNTCGHYEIQDVVRETRKRDLEVYGYVFFHMQDTDRVVGGHELQLRYGTLGREPAADIEVGRAVVAALREHGLSPTWNESPDTTITIGSLAWRRRHRPREGAELVTPEASFRRIAGAFRSLVCASFVGTTQPFGEAWVWLREDARALAWARAPLGGTRSAVSDSVTADALSAVARALMLRGDCADGHRIWAEAFIVPSWSSPSTLLSLVAKAPLSDASVFAAAQRRVMEIESNLWGAATVAWFALRAETSLPREQREHLAQRAASIFERERPRSEYSEENLAQGALACALVAFGKNGLLPNVPPLAIELAEAARTPPEYARSGLREELAARAIEITDESPPRGVSSDDENAGAFAQRAYDTFVRGGEVSDAVRADFEQAKRRWTEFVEKYDQGLIDGTELASGRTSLAILHAVFGERAEALAGLRRIGADAQAECEAQLATTKRALAAVAEGKPLALAVVSAMETKAMRADVVKRALDKWSSAQSRSDLLKVRRYAGVIMAEARTRFAAGDPKGASDLTDVVLAQTTPDDGFPDVLLLPALLSTMTVLGRESEAAELAARELVLTPGTLAAQAIALLALGDNEGARACMSEATNGPLRLADALEIAVGLVGVMKDPRASASALLVEIAAGEVAIGSLMPRAGAT